MSNNLAFTGVIQSYAYFLLIRVFHTNFMERQQQQAMNMTLLAGGDGRGDEQTETSAKVAAMAAQRFGVQTETPTTNSSFTYSNFVNTYYNKYNQRLKESSRHHNRHHLVRCLNTKRK